MFNSLKKMSFGFLFFSLFLGLASSAQALVEVSGGYQALIKQGNDGNWTNLTSLGKTTEFIFTGARGFGGDVRFNIPWKSLQLGARYGQFGLDASTTGVASLMMDATTYSALVSYRIINTGLLLGPVFTYAVAGSGSLKNSLSSTGDATATAESVSGYTAGIEVGIKIPFLVSGEVGYGGLNMEKFSNNQTIGGSPTKVALSGVFAKLSVGFSF